MTMTNYQKQGVYLTILMVLLALAVTGVTVFFIYTVSLEERRKELVETAQGQARLIEAIARYDRQHALNSGETYDMEVTIGQVKDAHRQFSGFGDTGEFVLGKQEGEQIVFLLSHRHFDLDQPQPVPIAGVVAEPMRRALRDESGSLIGLDYRSETVVAAYEPVAELGLGLVAKVDLTEVRAPFIRAGLLAIGITFILAIVGAYLFQRFTASMIRRIESSEERLQTAIAGTSDGLWLWDVKAGTVWHAPQWLRLLGYVEGERLPENYEAWESRIHPDDRERVLKILSRHLEGRAPYDCELRLRTKSGDYRWFRDRGMAIRDQVGHAIKMGGSIQDITDLKLAEEQLRVMSRVIAQAGEAIVITDQQGVIQYINPAFTRLTGYEQADALGKRAWIARPGQSGEEPYRELWREVSSGQTWQAKIADRKKSGESFPSLLTISPIFNDRGEITHYAGIQQDLTKFESLEAQLRQSQKMEAIGTLVGGIAHNFNNALAGITGNLFLAKAEAHELPKVVKRLARVEQLSANAAEMIQHLMTFARKSMVQRRVICINTLCQEAIQLAKVTVTERVRLSHQIGEEKLYVFGDKTELQQALINLINNALDAVNDVSDPVISISLQRFVADDTFLHRHQDAQDREFACISVSDNGIGIAPEHLEHIFEPFFTTKEVGKGTGLGLSMVFGAVQASHGAIDVTTGRDGRGVTFTIYLPLQPAEEKPEPAQPAVKIEKGQGELILWVDDDQDVLATGEAVLKSLNYKVLTANDGATAVEKYIEHQNEVALVILDVVMPGMGGLETLQKVREINPEVRVIFATGYDKSNLVGERPDYGSEEVLTKPFTMASFSQAIRSRLQGG